MRIVAGTNRGRVLAAPGDNSIRPTSDRVRESVFSIIQSRHRDLLDGGNVLDGFAGTGALGLEALSRGANFVLFVDDSAQSRALIRANIETCAAQGNSKLFRRDVTQMGKIEKLQPFDIVFLDPPYRRQLGEAALKSLSSGGWIKPGALVVWEEDIRASAGFLPMFKKLDERKFGSTSVTFLTYTA